MNWPSWTAACKSTKKPPHSAGARKTVKAKLQMQLGFYHCSHYMAECDV
jgi:hypothetical protein